MFSGSSPCHQTAEIEDFNQLADVTSSLGKVPRLMGARSARCRSVQRSAGRRPPAIRPKPADQGIPEGRHTKTARAWARAVGWTAGLGSSKSSGSTRYSDGVCGAGSVQVPRYGPPISVLGGGDEETRTPDPLLAKEMLFQLSYVPLPVGRGLGERVGWWAFLDSNQRPLPYQGSALTS